MTTYRLNSAIRVGLIALAFVGCTAMTGKSAGRNVDDAAITAGVKAKLAADESLSTITRIDVDTNDGTVYLNGIVDNEIDRLRAAELARQVHGVYKVTNNLTVKGRG